MTSAVVNLRTNRPQASEIHERECHGASFPIFSQQGSAVADLLDLYCIEFHGLAVHSQAFCSDSTSFLQVNLQGGLAAMPQAAGLISMHTQAFERTVNFM